MDQRKIRGFFIPLFLFILIISTVNANDLTITETFGTDAFNRTQDCTAGLMNLSNFETDRNQDLLNGKLSSFDNDWGCVFYDENGGSDTGSWYLNQSGNKINTDMGYTYSVKGNGGGNFFQGLWTEFDQYRKIQNDSEFSYYCSNMAINEHTFIRFWNATKPMFSIPISRVSGSECSLTGADYGDYCCTLFGNRLNNDGYACDGLTSSKVNFTGEYLNKWCPTLVNLSTDIIKSIDIFSGSSSQIRYDFDDLSITLANGSNNVPRIIDFDINETVQCLPAKTDPFTKTFQISSLNVTDDEGDTILYSLGATAYKSKDLTFFEDFCTFKSDTPKADYSVFDNGVIISNYTAVKSDVEAALWYLRLIDDEQSIHIRQNTQFCDGLLATPDGVENFYLDLNNKYNGNTTIDFYLGFKYNDTYMSILPVQDDGQKLFNLTFNKSTNGNLSIYVDSNLIYNKANTKYFFYDNTNTINVVLTSAPEYNYTEIFISTDVSSVIYQVNQSYNNINRILFNTRDTKSSTNDDYWYLKDITVFGKNFDLVKTYTSTVPTGVDISQVGPHEVTLWVTDATNQALGLENNATVLVNLQVCENIVTPSQIITPSVTNAFKSFRTSWKSYCSAFDSSVNKSNGFTWTGLLSLCGLAVLIYGFFMFVVGAFVSKILNDISWGLITWLVLMLFADLLLGLSAWFRILIGILLVILASMKLRDMFGGNHSPPSQIGGNME